MTEGKRSVGFLLGVGIFFFPYVFGWFTLRSGHSTLSRVLSFGWMLLIVGSILAQPSSKAPAADRVAATGVAPATPEPVAPEMLEESCGAVVKKFSTSSKLSDLQRDEAWKSYVDKGFEWRMRVDDVQSSTFGGYNVFYKCASGSRSLVFDISMLYPETAKAKVLELQKGKVYKVKGTLRTYGDMLGIGARPL